MVIIECDYHPKWQQVALVRYGDGLIPRDRPLAWDTRMLR
jgi:hypothetical protein